MNAQITWEAFRPDLQRVHKKARKNNAGAKPHDVILMFKILLLQQQINAYPDRHNKNQRAEARSSRHMMIKPP